MLSNVKLPNFTLPTVKSMLQRFRTVALVACLALLLSGCVKYDVGVTFDSQHSGEIVQTVKLGDRLSALNGSSARQWLDNLESRARKLNGKAKRVSRQELQVKIPFTTGKDFRAKFNQFFQAMGNPDVGADTGDGADIAASLSFQQANFLLGERNHLVLDVDLQSLGIMSDDETIVVNPGSLLDLEFRLNGVAAASKQKGPDAVQGQKVPGGMVWQLNPGQLNHIEATFWMPSKLGLSALGLIGVIAASIYFKENLSDL